MPPATAITVAAPNSSQNQRLMVSGSSAMKPLSITCPTAAGIAMVPAAARLRNSAIRPICTR